MDPLVVALFVLVFLALGAGLCEAFRRRTRWREPSERFFREILDGRLSIVDLRGLGRAAYAENERVREQADLKPKHHFYVPLPPFGGGQMECNTPPGPPSWW